MKLYFIEERDMDFLSAYKTVIKDHGRNAPFIKKEILLSEAILKPAKRFYVSEEQSFRVISGILRGNSLNIRNELKQSMYEEILLRVNKEQEMYSYSLKDAIRSVINQQAPRFYLTLESAQIMYYKIIRSGRR